jgi:two-component system, NarL family, sensor histidine kinase DesK
MRRARVVTLVALALNASMAVFLPAIGLFREPDPVRVALGAVGIALFCLAQAAALHAVVTPWLGAAARRRARTGLAVASVLSLPLVGPLGGGNWPSWAWLAACIVGLLPVLTGRWAALALSAAAVAAALLTAPPVPVLVVVLGVGAGIAAVNGLHVWFWELLVQAERGRAAEARLAAGEERLRFARDVHDLLGHRLSVIALKAELAERTDDGARARREAAEVRELAASALAELREVVHGYRRVDLREQLAAIQQVLTSSGVRCTVTAPEGELPAAAPLAAVLREASTNVLRHSTAAWCTIDVVHDGASTTMTVVNDGAREAAPDPHSHGLRGLADRLAESGGTLRARVADGRFTVEAVVPAGP